MSLSTTDTEAKCLCNHTTTFSKNWFVPPNKIDFKTVFAKFKDIKDNLAVSLTVIILFLVYVVLSIIARQIDKDDILRVSILPFRSTETTLVT